MVMTAERRFDTVAFDVRDETSMLFFARTSGKGEILDYLLVMRAEGDGLDNAVYLEVNEQLLAGHDLIREARMTGNVITLALHEPASTLGGIDEIVLTYEETDENRASLERGAFRVLGGLMAGGHA